MLRDIAVARSDDGGMTFRPFLVNRDGWDVNACPIAGAAMTIDALDRIHVVWFTQAGETPRLYLASSSDHGVSFTKPVVFDPAQKLAKHAHVVAGSGNRRPDRLGRYEYVVVGEMGFFRCFDAIPKTTWDPATIVLSDHRKQR